MIILILGGARSGKSSYAVEIAKKLSKKVVFIATATSPDEEMKERIKLHRLKRPKYWKVIEQGKDIELVLPALKGKFEVVIIDCIGLFISNLLAENLNDKEIQERIQRFIDAILKSNLTTIIVSNEVGMGIVPDNLLARRFRDLTGIANQLIARESDEVIFMQAGIPLKLKNK
ncbi:MAG: bifunctional adenosylcobinamide kinase/adenosylcobinamide-phosphate guanylyltransferase [Candidatus Hydrogenedentota bacterium]